MSIHIANGFHVSNYAALAVLMQNFSLDWQNLTHNSSVFQDEYYDQADIFTSLPGLKAIFYALYIIIFFLGICGNVLVCYVVFRNKSMQTVTNFFITNLALSDILLCTFAVPFTPLYMFLRQWVFGEILCHLVPYAQGVSVYISAFTLMSIAIDRFFVIIYPFKPRLQVKYCYLIIILVWLLAGLLTLPYGIFMDLIPTEKGLYCDEVWPYESSRKAFGFSTSILQFVIPFFIITFCYMKVCIKLKNRARTKPGTKSVKKEEMERERTRRTNRMLITMVVIFGASWLPINIYNLIIDFYIPAASWTFLNVIFFLSHAAAMSSTCYNPFLYAWLNENFRKEFMIVLPCFNSDASVPNASTRRGVSGKTDKPCNGHENMTLLPMKDITNKDRKLQKDRIGAIKNNTSVTDTVRINVTSNDLDPI
ncbi:prolactin-releasing peptide receptor-like [Stegodyphus dumicola]|uniref:prolactin-releasing peptide receptor-like n=1 Tax=Stegodyphus dumicola TaxID=202533 RepID=UPI0015AD9CF8|nr:prolactin-releasing peptide receptor-like [Stegodyphus dumicola]